MGQEKVGGGSVWKWKKETRHRLTATEIGERGSVLYYKQLGRDAGKEKQKTNADGGYVFQRKEICRCFYLKEEGMKAKTRGRKMSEKSGMGEFFKNKREMV